MSTASATAWTPIVLLGADSVETIEQTHSSYFEPVDGFERFFELAAS